MITTRGIVSLLALGILLGLLAPHLLVAPRQAPPVAATMVEEATLEPVKPVAKGLPEIHPGMSVRKRKEVFFSYLLPMVQAENARLASVRRRLLYIREHLHSGREPYPVDRQWLEKIRQKYDVDLENFHHPGFWTLLLERVDQLPENLVLIQAANESAWGTSRFAREGNNLFGQWCFRPGCGMVPEGRPAGEIYEVASFPSPQASVAAYMHNLNRGRAYEELRRIRAALRASGAPVTAGALAVGLGRYSQRGQEYVWELQSMLRTNRTIIAGIRQKLARTKEAL